MLNRPTPESVRKVPAEWYWLVAAVVIAAASVVLALTDLDNIGASWALRIGAAVAAVGWMVRAAEARLADALSRAVERAWWMGYATCLEDQGEQMPRVVPLRRRGR